MFFVVKSLQSPSRRSRKWFWGSERAAARANVYLFSFHFSSTLPSVIPSTELGCWWLSDPFAENSSARSIKNEKLFQSSGSPIYKLISISSSASASCARARIECRSCYVSLRSQCVAGSRRLLSHLLIFQARDVGDIVYNTARDVTVRMPPLIWILCKFLAMMR